MVGLYQEVVQEGKLHLSAHRGIITLMEKVDKCILKLKSWRPLTLLNLDGKIYRKILANRMNKALNDKIHYSQTGFMKGRSLHENVMKIMEVINHCNASKVDGLLIGFDFLKAFDTVEWEAMFQSLVAFNFGHKFLNMVITLFTDPLVCVSNNGYLSEFFSPTRACRQGCTFSPSIFTVTVELLGIALRQNPNISGIKIGDYEVK